MPCYDCIFINSDNELVGMHRMEVVRAIFFVSFVYLNITYPCALFIGSAASLRTWTRTQGCGWYARISMVVENQFLQLSILTASFVRCTLFPYLGTHSFRSISHFITQWTISKAFMPIALLIIMLLTSHLRRHTRVFTPCMSSHHPTCSHACNANNLLLKGVEQRSSFPPFLRWFICRVFATPL
jgi:hypothetical protein